MAPVLQKKDHVIVSLVNRTFFQEPGPPENRALGHLRAGHLRAGHLRAGHLRAGHLRAGHLRERTFARADI